MSDHVTVIFLMEPQLQPFLEEIYFVRAPTDFLQSNMKLIQVETFFHHFFSLNSVY